MAASTPESASPATPSHAPTGAPILSVRDLWVDYRVPRGLVQAVRGASFDIHAGETLALIGESGSGKTTLALAIIRLLARTATIRQGQVRYWRNGRSVDVLSLRPGDLRRFRWKECALVFQSALNALNPVLRVWDQLYDAAAAHGGASRDQVRRRAHELLRLVQLEPERVLRAYPHELSGGMRQRVLLALGLLLDPQLIILDEPTTALDILTQRTIIDLLRRLKEELGVAMILVSHDLSLAAELADRVATMYAGQIVEQASVRALFYAPRHPYTVGLLRAVPTLSGDFRRLESVGGSPPDLIQLPPGCTFHPRCPFADQRCRQEAPPLAEVIGTAARAPGRDAGDSGVGGAERRGHAAACWHADLVSTAWEASRQTNGHVDGQTGQTSAPPEERLETEGTSGASEASGPWGPR